jgi:DNA-binding MarR family transcriptional regulator
MERHRIASVVIAVAAPPSAYRLLMLAMPPTLGFVLHDVARLLRKRFEQQVRQLGLTRSKWQVLAHLARNQGIQQGALAEILEVEPITLCRIVDRLEAAGLVRRQRHPTDRRVWRLHLTEAAEPILETMTRISHTTRAAALAGVAPDEQDRLLEMLTKMRANLIDACHTQGHIQGQETAHG